MEIEELQFENEDTSKSQRLSKQRESLKRLINVNALREVQYDINQIPTSLQYLDMLCNCGHGERTIGTCAHRGSILRGLRNLFRNRIPLPAHPISTHMSQLQINIEQDIDNNTSVSDDDDDVWEYSDYNQKFVNVFL